MLNLQLLKLLFKGDVACRILVALMVLNTAIVAVIVMGTATDPFFMARSIIPVVTDWIDYDTAVATAVGIFIAKFLLAIGLCDLNSFLKRRINIHLNKNKKSRLQVYVVE